jgi:hypothetical protein
MAKQYGSSVTPASKSSSSCPAAKAATPSPDFFVENHGSIFLLRPVTDAGRDWVDNHISQEGFQPYWPIIVVDHSYIRDIVSGIFRDGLVCR